MGGPAAAVFLRVPLSEEQKLAVRAAIAALSDPVEDDDFWINGRPFFLSFGEDYEGEFACLADDGIPAVTGWTPADAIGLGAMCNQPEDHRILGELCVRFARMFDGLIDFSGTLDTMRSTPPADATPFYAIDTKAGFVWHLGGPKFLEWWLQQPEFRMVK